VEFTALTDALNQFVAIFDAGAQRIAPYALTLLGLLILIDIALTGAWAIFGEASAVQFLKKFLFLATWTWLTRNFGRFAKMVVDSLMQAGFIAGGHPTEDFGILLDPSKIASYGLHITSPLVAQWENASIFTGPSVFVYGLLYLFLIACYFFMACQVFLAVLEYYAHLAVVGILFPFGAWSHTRFLAEKSIGAVVANGIKLMVLALLFSVVQPLFDRLVALPPGTELTLNRTLSMLLCSLVMTYLVWKAPDKAAALLSGSPSLSLAGAAQNVASGIRTAAAGAALATGAGGAAVAATKVAATAVGATAKGGAILAGAASSGFQLGAATSTGGALARFTGGAAGAVRSMGSVMADGAASAARRILPQSNGPSAFERGAKAAFQPSAKPPSPSSPTPANAVPAPPWSAKEGGYPARQSPHMPPSEGAGRRGIYIGTNAPDDAGAPGAPLGPVVWSVPSDPGTPPSSPPPPPPSGGPDPSAPPAAPPPAAPPPPAPPAPPAPNPVTPPLLNKPAVPTGSSPPATAAAAAATPSSSPQRSSPSAPPPSRTPPISTDASHRQPTNSPPSPPAAQNPTAAGRASPQPPPPRAAPGVPSSSPRVSNGASMPAPSPSAAASTRPPSTAEAAPHLSHSHIQVISPPPSWAEQARRDLSRDNPKVSN
jgi:type IV secretion system protein TrbL